MTEELYHNDSRATSKKMKKTMADEVNGLMKNNVFKFAKKRKVPR